jgi:hypothetical protein
MDDGQTGERRAKPACSRGCRALQGRKSSVVVRPGTASYRQTVKQLLKSVVRQIRTLRFVGAGGGQLPQATRWAISDDRPYRDSNFGVPESLVSATFHFKHQRTLTCQAPSLGRLPL